MKLILPSILSILLLNLISFGQTQSNDVSSDSHDKIVRVTVVLNCSADQAFRYFTENDLLTKWLTAKADVELKEGGKYELFWTPQDTDLTNNSTFGCKVLSFERPYYLNVEWRGNANHKDFMNNVRPLTNVTVVFHELNDKSTKVTLLHTGWRQDKNWEEAREFFINAWKGAFKQLEEIL